MMYTIELYIHALTLYIMVNNHTVTVYYMYSIMNIYKQYKIIVKKIVNYILWYSTRSVEYMIDGKNNSNSLQNVDW